MKKLIFIILWIPNLAFAQLTVTQQTAFNAAGNYANKSAAEITDVVKSIISYKERKGTNIYPFTCPVQQDQYHFGNASTLLEKLGPLGVDVLAKIKLLKTAADKIDEQCKNLDTYHKLEDYKKDNYAGANKIIEQIGVLVKDYKKKQDALSLELEPLNRNGLPAPYRETDKRMQRHIAEEKKLLDQLTFNLNEDIHTGWITEKIQQNVVELDATLAEMKRIKPPINYPASSMWPNFVEGVGEILESKRTALDGYNNDAKKSDRHTNQFYLDLINYYNGILVADHHTFIEFSQRDGYYGIGALAYVPGFEFKTAAENVSVDVAPFKDIPRTAPKIIAQKTAIAKPAFQALTNYVDFINEGGGEMEYMRQVLSNFSSSAASYAEYKSYERRNALPFSFKDYEIPQSQYLKTIAGSKVLAPDIAKSLNDQTAVLLSIMKEMNELSATIELEARTKKYEQDRVKHIYEILERQGKLLRIWDDRKEILYTDVRNVFKAYPPAAPTSSWLVSGKALLGLADLNHDALFKARSHYRDGESVTIETDPIEQTIRTVISKEFENLKGIQKLGSNNGNDPYTPYEYIPENSKTLVENFQAMKPAAGKTGYQHPYHNMVYLYNRVVENYNKFSELSTTVPLLKLVYQPELFLMRYPESRPSEATASNTTPAPVETVSAKQEEPKKGTQQEPKKEPAVTQSTPDNSQVVTKSETKKDIQHDTVYIEKRDTIYLKDPSMDTRSMEGYATNNMVLLLDVSGSMNTPEKLPLVKTSVLDMISMMRPEDKISIIVFSGKPKVLLASTSFKDEAKIKKAIDGLQSSGKTDGNAGLKLAYKTADQYYIRGGNNRIVLATDGEFPVSDETEKQIESFSTQDIFLSIFNFGKSPRSNQVLGRLAQLGKGNYELVTKENLELKLIREAKSKKKK